MRAAVSHSLTRIEVTELPSTVLRPGDLRVQVRASGVNPVDWKMREGGPLRMAQRLLGPSGPFVVGVDFAGVIVEGASGAFAVGDRVVGAAHFARRQRGATAEEVVVQPDQLVKLPEGVSFEQAAAVGIPGSTGWVALVEHAKVTRGDRVLILGAAGAVGIASTQLARSLGAEVVGVCSKRNVAFVEGLGARAIDYTSCDALEAAKAFGPYKLVLDAVGTGTYPLSRQRALRAPDGIVDLVVVRASDVLTMVFDWRVKTLLGHPTPARLAPLVERLAAGTLTMPIEATFPLEAVAEAHERSRGGKVVGKLLILPTRASP